MYKGSKKFTALQHFNTDVALAVCDTIVILSGICFEIPVVYTSLKLYNGDRAYDAIYVNFIYNYYMRWSFYASRIIQRMVVIASVYLTMLITVERYICICHPFRFKQWCSYSRTCKLVAIIVIFSILYYMSLFWEFRLVGRTKMVNGQNVTLYKAEATELRRNPTYIKLKYVLMFIVVDYLLPLTCIITLNTFTYIKLRTINTERSSMTISQNNENKLTTMMLYVVVEFVVLTSLSGFISMARIFPIIITGYDVSHAFLILELQGLLNSLNSSVNFVTYVSSWEPFRKTFTEMMCCGEQRERLSANPDPLRVSPPYVHPHLIASPSLKCPPLLRGRSRGHGDKAPSAPDGEASATDPFAFVLLRIDEPNGRSR
ncbi:hypothetical protein GE061_003107 [Apolygus lucorum]|uniref:G-protein coupled receptors family 1 profile domain-containing protein n=1 Tax=Apolygus lucorum TaxID=248454 RepID=A0A6A4JNQ6_APOLU|nr:hypothetical protein GE061_003107 [Apolygus lucorum]